VCNQHTSGPLSTVLNPTHSREWWRLMLLILQHAGKGEATVDRHNPQL
jgi:hypothetical protein